MYMTAIKPNRTAISEAIRILREHITEAQKHEKMLSELPPIDKARDGQRAYDERVLYLDAEKKKQESKNSYAAYMLNQQKTKYFDFIKSQITPTGEFASSKWANLLRDNLIQNEEDLKELATEQGVKDETARRMIEAYANKMPWSSNRKAVFINATNYGLLEEFGKTFFNWSESACYYPTGYFGLCLTSDNALNGLANQCGMDNII